LVIQRLDNSAGKELGEEFIGWEKVLVDQYCFYRHCFDFQSRIFVRREIELP